jgi:hypothetical protein
MVKSPSHWEKPDSSKGTAATHWQDLKPGKPDRPTPRDSDWIRQAKEYLYE